MQRFLTLILLFCICSGVAGQTVAKGPSTAKKQQPSAPRKPPVAGNGYLYPIQNVAGYYAANFGEMRPNHFHAGVDIKTEGAQGRPLVAIADGYVSRVTVTPGGYGRVIYVVLNDGRTAVYGHISRFRNDIQKLVDDHRARERTNNAQLWFGPGQLPVRQGEVIAYSGNSGSSFGPHLHFELRDTTGTLLNTVRMGIFRPDDDIPPIVMRLHYIEVDTLRGVPVHAPPRSYNAALIGGGRYRLLHEGAVEAGRKGYFVLEASDRRNGVQNTFGLYRASLAVDSIVCVEYRMDAIPAGFSRYSNAVGHYPLKATSRNEVLRMACLAEAPTYFYPTLKERGLIRTAEGETQHIRIEAEDDCGNLSTLEFDIQGRAETFRAQADSGAIALRPSRAATVHGGNALTAYIPAGALYEPIFCRPERIDSCLGKAGVVVLSPVYRILDASTPLHKAMTIAIRTPVPKNRQTQTTLAARTRSGDFIHIGGRYANGELTARTSTTGEILVVADTLPPTIKPLFKTEADLSRQATLRFRVNDNFSGINEYSLHIDGTWVACDRFPMQGTLVHTFALPAAGRKHNAELIVSDACGNTASWKGTFYR